MKIRELIDELKKFNPETEIMILDGFNAGGYPREINVGPCEHTVSADDVDHCADAEDIGEGAEVIVLGYGCYWCLILRHRALSGLRAHISAYMRPPVPPPKYTTV